MGSTSRWPTHGASSCCRTMPTPSPTPDALWQYMSYFEREGGQNVGAVTGSMLAANRTTLTAQAQQNELNSIIGLIKRSQMSYGALFAFSGANTMYRKQAVLDVGVWHAEQPTEDIAIAWDMQASGLALSVSHPTSDLPRRPETGPRALYNQRRRWSSGGVYVLLTKGARPAAAPHHELPDGARGRGLLHQHRVELHVLDQHGAVWHHPARVVVMQDWERFWQSWTWSASRRECTWWWAGAATAASCSTTGGKTLNYIVFAPWYMLVYWTANTWTVVGEPLPTSQGVARREEGHGSPPSDRTACTTSARTPRGRRPDDDRDPRRHPPRGREGRHDRLVSVTGHPATKASSWSYRPTVGASPYSR